MDYHLSLAAHRRYICNGQLQPCRIVYVAPSALTGGIAFTLLETTQVAKKSTYSQFR
jgi:hypothetical protein